MYQQLELLAGFPALKREKTLNKTYNRSSEQGSGNLHTYHWAGEEDSSACALSWR